jgi:hypothetical protein
MATQIPRPLTMNRRQLLGTVPAIPMSGILPPQVSVDAVPVPSIPTSEPSPLNVCAATARRLEEITARNRIRAEACLPLLICTERTAADERGRRCSSVRSIC